MLLLLLLLLLLLVLGHAGWPATGRSDRRAEGLGVGLGLASVIPHLREPGHVQACCSSGRAADAPAGVVGGAGEAGGGVLQRADIGTAKVHGAPLALVGAAGAAEASGTGKGGRQGAGVGGRCGGVGAQGSRAQVHGAPVCCRESGLGGRCGGWVAVMGHHRGGLSQVLQGYSKGAEIHRGPARSAAPGSAHASGRASQVEGVRCASVAGVGRGSRVALGLA
eukprot:1158505-Pelagomonas_calceolata.AAC.1